MSERVNFSLLTVNDKENANNIPSYDRPQGTLPVVQHLICSAARTGKSSWTQLVFFCLFLAYLFLSQLLWVISPSFPMAVLPPNLPVHVNCSTVTLTVHCNEGSPQMVASYTLGSIKNKFRSRFLVLYIVFVLTAFQRVCDSSC